LDKWDFKRRSSKGRNVNMVMEYYKKILEITKDENVAKGVLQSMLLTGCSYIEILRCMGFNVS
jgi:uracil phosphoribosyltransferase